jgi:outer membrane biosynthesis protein TonB
MEENDEWKLGDEGERPPCRRCGKVNRPGLTHCVICGTALADEAESGRDVLRTIGESMGRRRPGGGKRPARSSFRAWWIAASVLLVVVAVLTWLQSGDQPFRLEDLRSRAHPTAVAPALTAIAPPPTAVVTKVVATATPRPVPTPAAVVAPPPLPTAVATAPPPPPAPTAHPTVLPTPKHPKPTKRRAAPTAVATPAPARATESLVEPTPVARPAVEATEKPSLGTDLQDATRAYRQAVDVHNARVDEYNALADEVQRRKAWDDSPESVELRRRLDRAREAVENARVDAEALRGRMESVRARYR